MVTAVESKLQATVFASLVSGPQSVAAAAIDNTVLASRDYCT